MTITVAFAGNPNVGKSTVFNALTGLRQHTGNWTGKTVAPAAGRWRLEGTVYEAVDLPGVYSLSGGTPEERLASDYLMTHSPDVLVAVLDATALERSLELALELRALHPRMVLCLNLTDEAQRLGLRPDCAALAKALRAPVVPTRADQKQSYELLRRTVALLASATAPVILSEAERSRRIRPPCGGGAADAPAPVILSEAERSRRIRPPCGQATVSPQVTASQLARRVMGGSPRPRRDWDRIFLGKWTAWPILLLLLFAVFYLTVRGANLPSALLEAGFSRLGERLAALLSDLPPTLRSLLLDGIYGTTTRVIAVMLPPMAIFFPLFSLLEDLGFLPRAALLMDRPFAACGSCGRQGLCMCMGLGCNAVGVTGCRIIPNEKERLAAILTNALVPCNGRFPTLILLAGLLLGRDGSLPAAAQAGFLTACLALSCAVTLGTTLLLRRSVLRGEEASFVLELPPFRRPRVGRLLLRSLLDRTLRVLGRAVTVAAPAGAVIWLLDRLPVGGRPLLSLLAAGLDPVAALLGLTGTLLLAFLLSFPANELLIPLALMIAGPTVAAGDPAALFPAGTALCAAVFTLFHWPCSTTVLTVWHETKSLKWTLLSVLLPTAVGVLLCAGVNLLVHL
jgi:ferrous iron transport protein B